MKKLTRSFIFLLTVVLLFTFIPFSAFALSVQQQEDIYRVSTYWEDEYNSQYIDWLLNSDSFVYHLDATQNSIITDLTYNSLNLDPLERKENFIKILSAIIEYTYDDVRETAAQQSAKDFSLFFLSSFDEYIYDKFGETENFINTTLSATNVASQLCLDYYFTTSSSTTQLSYDRIFNFIQENITDQTTLRKVNSYFEAFKTSSEWQNKWSSYSEAFSIVGKSIDIAKDTLDIAIELDSYQKTDERFINLLQYVQSNTTDFALASACGEVANRINNGYLENFISEFIKTLGTSSSEIALGVFIDALSKSNLAVRCATLGYTAGTIISNWFFNTDKIINQIQSIYCLNEISEVLVPLLKKELSNFKSYTESSTTVANRAANIIYHMKTLICLRRLGEESYYKLKDSVYGSLLIKAVSILPWVNSNESKKQVENWYSQFCYVMNGVEGSLFKMIPAQYYSPIIAPSIPSGPSSPPSTSKEVTVVKFSVEQYTLQLNYTVDIPAYTYPSNATIGTDITYSSSNTSIITVDSYTGKITPVSPGQAYVYAKSSNGCTAKCLITVPHLEVTSVDFSEEEAYLMFNSTAIIPANIYPANATSGTKITYSSSNTSIFTVNSSTGEVTPVSPGSAYLYAKTSNNRTAKCLITIYPFSVREVNGDYEISDCVRSATSAPIPSKWNGKSITSISDTAFGYCDSLENITIPSSVSNIGTPAFHGCDSLEVITVDPNNKHYSSENGVLFDYSKTTLLQFPRKKNVTQYAVPTSVICIEEYAFFGCDLLTKIIIGDSVETIKYNAFYSCGTLKSVKLGNSVKIIGTQAFRYCSSLTDINLPNTVETICQLAFYECKSLISISIPDSVKEIEYGAFAGCKSLTNVKIGKSVTSIEGSAFSNCDSLTSIVIPDSVTSIEGSAFSSCDSLTSITIPDSVTSIGNSAFGYCNSLTSITVDSDNKNYASENGVLFNKNKTTLIQYPAGKTDTSYTIPDSVTSIEDWAFAYCNYLTSITIGGSVRSIGSYAFLDCASLTTVYYTGTHLQWYRISRGSYNDPLKNATKVYNCYDVASLSITSLPTKTEYKLGESLDLTGLVLTATLNNGETKTITEDFEISGFDSATAGVKTITVTYNGKASTFNVTVKEPNISWSYNSSSGALTISGEGAMPDYSGKDMPWAHLQNQIYAINIEDGITSIGKWAFAYCYYARSVNIPDSVTSIDSSAFYYCISLEEVLIPESVGYLGGGVFSYCKGLRSISIPAKLTTVNKYTLYDCNSLSSVYYSGSNEAWSAIDKTSGNDPLSKANVIVNTTAGTTWSYENGVLTIGGYGRMENYTSKTTPWFEHANDIKKIVVQEGVTGLGNYAFGYCSYAKEIQLPESLVHIGSNVFYKCVSLESIDIPEGVTRIYGAAFYGCSKLKSITLPVGIDTIYAHTFMSCGSLTDVSFRGTKVQFEKINVLANNEPLTANGVNYLVKSIEWTLSEDGTLTIGGGCAMDDYELNKAPMAPWAEVKSQIKRVVIQEGIPNIGKNAFYGCLNLTEVVIPDSVVSIGYGAFMSTSLKKISIPENVTYIGSSAFNGCALLTEVNVPAGVTNIYSYTFYNCKRLSKVTLGGDKANINIVATGNEYFTALIG